MLDHAYRLKKIRPQLGLTIPNIEPAPDSVCLLEANSFRNITLAHLIKIRGFQFPILLIIYYQETSINYGGLSRLLSKLMKPGLDFLMSNGIPNMTFGINLGTFIKGYEYATLNHGAFLSSNWILREVNFLVNFFNIKKLYYFYTSTLEAHLGNCVFLGKTNITLGTTCTTSITGTTPIIISQSSCPYYHSCFIASVLCLSLDYVEISVKLHYNA